MPVIPAKAGIQRLYGEQTWEIVNDPGHWTPAKAGVTSVWLQLRKSYQNLLDFRISRIQLAVARMATILKIL